MWITTIFVNRFSTQKIHVFNRGHIRENRFECHLNVLPFNCSMGQGLLGNRGGPRVRPVGRGVQSECVLGQPRRFQVFGFATLARSCSRIRESARISLEVRGFRVDPWSSSSCSWSPVISAWSFEASAVPFFFTFRT